MFYQIFEALDRKFGFEKARAHCDVPCGIYDPITAQIAALTVVRMIDLMDALEGSGKDFDNSMSRYIAVKEEHAEKAKHEIRVIWGDYIKAQHVEQHPDVHALTHKIMQLGSKNRQTKDRAAALEFVEAINQFAEIFWATKGVKTKRAKAPYAPALELVYPDL
ncbi:MAG: superoxide dismutase, Ni [Anaerolineales bacterium]|nr:superoxide dismutase, Ni [Anaerolineales bacterium]